jgi:hypothetical protein
MQREDLRFVLYPASRTLAQLMRKIFAQGMPELMNYPDKLLMDNLVMLLSDEECVSPTSSAKERFYGAFMAMTGTSLSTPFERHASIPPHWWVDTDYWRDDFYPNCWRWKNANHAFRWNIVGQRLAICSHRTTLVGDSEATPGYGWRCANRYPVSRCRTR